MLLKKKKKKLLQEIGPLSTNENTACLLFPLPYDVVLPIFFPLAWYILVNWGHLIYDQNSSYLVFITGFPIVSM